MSTSKKKPSKEAVDCLRVFDDLAHEAEATLVLSGFAVGADSIRPGLFLCGGDGLEVVTDDLKPYDFVAFDAPFGSNLMNYASVLPTMRNSTGRHDLDRVADLAQLVYDRVDAIHRDPTDPKGGLLEPGDNPGLGVTFTEFPDGRQWSYRLRPSDRDASGYLPLSLFGQTSCLYAILRWRADRLLRAAPAPHELEHVAAIVAMDIHPFYMADRDLAHLLDVKSELTRWAPCWHQTKGVEGRPYQLVQPVPVCEVAKQIDVRSDLLLRQLRRMEARIDEGVRPKQVELADVLRAKPARRQSIQTWADKKYPAGDS